MEYELLILKINLLFLIKKGTYPQWDKLGHQKRIK